MTAGATKGWIHQLSADLRQEGSWRFWCVWRVREPALRAAAYRRGRFTSTATRLFDRYAVVQMPRGIAWLEGILAALTPVWMPGAESIQRSPRVAALCCHPLPFILGVAEALTPEVVAHEFAHIIWYRLPAPLHQSFGDALAWLEASDFRFGPWLDEALQDYKTARGHRECHVRILEYYCYGRVAIPEPLHPYYRGWVDLVPR